MIISSFFIISVVSFRVLLQTRTPAYGHVVVEMRSGSHSHRRGGIQQHSFGSAVSTHAHHSLSHSKRPGMLVMSQAFFST